MMEPHRIRNEHWGARAYLFIRRTRRDTSLHNSIFLFLQFLLFFLFLSSFLVFLFCFHLVELAIKTHCCWGMLDCKCVQPSSVNRAVTVWRPHHSKAPLVGGFLELLLTVQCLQTFITSNIPRWMQHEMTRFLYLYREKNKDNGDGFPRDIMLYYYKRVATCEIQPSPEWNTSSALKWSFAKQRVTHSHGKCKDSNKELFQRTWEVLQRSRVHIEKKINRRVNRQQSKNEENEEEDGGGWYLLVFVCVGGWIISGVRSVTLTWCPSRVAPSGCLESQPAGLLFLPFFFSFIFSQFLSFFLSSSSPITLFFLLCFCWLLLLSLPLVFFHPVLCLIYILILFLTIYLCSSLFFPISLSSLLHFSFLLLLFVCIFPSSLSAAVAIMQCYIYLFFGSSPLACRVQQRNNSCIAVGVIIKQISESPSFVAFFFFYCCCCLLPSFVCYRTKSRFFFMLPRSIHHEANFTHIIRQQFRRRCR